MFISKNTAKAIIIKNSKVLLLKKQYEDNEVTFTLPGGTQEAGETLEQAVIREVFEEVAARVSVKRLVNVYEHQHPSRKAPDIVKHKVEFAFLCQLTEDYHPQMGLHPDPHQVAVEWIDIRLLSELTMAPKGLSEVLNLSCLSGENIYLGQIL